MAPPVARSVPPLPRRRGRPRRAWRAGSPRSRPPPPQKSAAPGAGALGLAVAVGAPPHYRRRVQTPPRPAGLEVRAATGSDRAAVIRLLTAQLREHQLPVDEDGVARAVELALTHGASAWLVVATLHGLPAGVLLANPILSVEKGGGSLWIEELYVAPERRRRGVARALLSFVIAEARLHGLCAVELQVVPSQGAAFALYRALGFVANDRVAHVLDL